MNDVRIYVTNRLPVATSVHWHGLYLPNGMDGVGGLTQPYIKAGETGRYEWTLRQYGSFMFHAHHDEMTQMGMGLIGMFVVHPRNPSADYRVDRDFSLMISEWSVKAGTSRPNTLEMTDFNVLTINGKVFPSTAPLVCKTGDRVRLRLGNLGAMDHHPMHIHGYHFRITATDGEDIPLSALGHLHFPMPGLSCGTFAVPADAKIKSHADCQIPPSMRGIRLPYCMYHDD